MVANAHDVAPTKMMAAVRDLAEELDADDNGMDPEGYTAMHNAASSHFLARSGLHLQQMAVAKGLTPTLDRRNSRTSSVYTEGFGMF